LLHITFTMNNIKALNILERIAEIKKRANLVKTGVATDLNGNEFNYATYEDVLRAVKGLMDEYKIISNPDINDACPIPIIVGNKLIITQDFTTYATDIKDAFLNSVVRFTCSLANESTAIMTLAKKALYMQLFDLTDIEPAIEEETKGQKAIFDLTKRGKLK
jgi:hypothetical protein